MIGTIIFFALVIATFTAIGVLATSASERSELRTGSVSAWAGLLPRGLVAVTGTPVAFLR